MRGFFAGLLCFILSAGQIAAEGINGATPLRTLSTADDTRGWEAVGRLNFGGHAYCTGACGGSCRTLISPIPKLIA